MNNFYDIFSEAFTSTSNAPFTHVFNQPKRWTTGQYLCLVEQGYRGPNTKNMTFTWSEKAL